MYKGYENIKVESSCCIKMLEGFELTVEPNEHAKLWIRGVLEEEFALNLVETELMKESVRVSEISQNQSEAVIISAKIESAKVINENGVFYVEIIGRSGSIDFDMLQKSRSFQNINITYKELVKSVICDTMGSDAIVEPGKDEKINRPFIQFKETDWEFLKRIASQVNTFIVPETRSSKPRFWLGMPKGRVWEIEPNVDYKVCNDIGRFIEMGVNEKGKRPHELLFYEIRTHVAMEVGDQVKFKEKDLAVWSKKAKIEKGLLVYTYVLGFRNLLASKKKQNMLISGMSIKGRVLDTRKQLAKLHLEIDEKQELENANWYPYSPETGNAMYCMPKKGTIAALYFPDENEERAQIIGCIRTNGKLHKNIFNPKNRYFTTENDKQMAILPGQISFKGTGDDSSGLKLSIIDASGDESLSSEQGIRFESNKAISIISKSKMQINSDKKIIICSVQQIEMNRPMDVRFSVENEFHSWGKNVIVYGSRIVQYEPFDDEPKRRKTHPFLAAIVTAAIGIAAIALVCVVPTLGLGILATPVISMIVCATIPVMVCAHSDIYNEEFSGCRLYAAKFFSGAATGFIAGFGGQFNWLVNGWFGGAGTVAGMHVEEWIMGEKLYSEEDYEWGFRVGAFANIVGVLLDKSILRGMTAAGGRSVSSMSKTSIKTMVKKFAARFGFSTDKEFIRKILPRFIEHLDDALKTKGLDESEKLVLEGVKELLTKKNVSINTVKNVVAENPKIVIGAIKEKFLQPVIDSITIYEGGKISEFINPKNEDEDDEKNNEIPISSDNVYLKDYSLVE